MKSTIAAVGLLASLASASAQQPHHFHWRRDNSTASAGFTTLTVQVTEVATVTSCAPTITNCPARSATLSASDLHTYVVTNIVVLTETICPVAEAASISKSLIDQHATGGLPGSTLTAPAVTPTAAPSVPLNTAGVTTSAQDAAATSPPPAGGNGQSDDEDDCPADDGDVVTTVTQIISTKTLTITVGKGATASVVTTAIPTTIESTILVALPAAGATTPAGAADAADAASTGEPTTTVTATSTNTRTVTVKRPNPTGAGSSGSGSGTGLGAEGECSCPAAVTVTVPASTVYVTIGGSAPTAVAPTAVAAAAVDASSATTSTPAAAAITGEASAGGESNDDSDDEDDCPADDDVVTISTTVMVAPYPTNGTASAGAAKPTAHKRSDKLF
ncbi:hypothetical protein CGRA01v4_01853 [Colletotrichum graminicola]|uniref:Uncharacterized protein n=1 Tax=Colletotrichum graminicola (strain M1.001 / M2 / FGSC 10212) TaxID=645133 RepID=E3QJY5_COLGM|nr:uncharacterized protein GLRG_06317 [Colletotrichum graminicola M1.001]EFQ31173.1 hypothetical protein GLRG_06317 [Colletotrichum graminicola M1.001]WDK10574.1 hypothetical protein CGRA01v4_01853 [Colletotrichum graminicola]